MDANFLLWSVKFLKKNKKILILQKLDHCGRAAKIRSFSNPIKVRSSFFDWITTQGNGYKIIQRGFHHLEIKTIHIRNIQSNKA